MREDNVVDVNQATGPRHPYCRFCRHYREGYFDLVALRFQPLSPGRRDRGGGRVVPLTSPKKLAFKKTKGGRFFALTEARRRYT
jgi:hypothetical protein